MRKWGMAGVSGRGESGMAVSGGERSVAVGGRCSDGFGGERRGGR